MNSMVFVGGGGGGGSGLFVLVILPCWGSLRVNVENMAKLKDWHSLELLNRKELKLEVWKSVRDKSASCLLSKHNCFFFFLVVWPWNVFQWFFKCSSSVLERSLYTGNIEAWQIGLKSQPCHFLLVWPWRSYFIFPCLGGIYCKIEIIYCEVWVNYQCAVTDLALPIAILIN